MCERDRMLQVERSDFFSWIKVKEWFWSCNSLPIYASFLVIVAWDFYIWNLFQFFGGFVQSVIKTCSSNSIVQSPTQLSDGICNVKGDSQLWYKVYKNGFFNPANTYEKHIVSEKCCLARYNDKMCFLLKYWFHFIPIGDIKELLKKLGSICFNYQQVDCLYTLFKYRFSGKCFVNCGQLFDNVQKAVLFNLKNRRVDRMPSNTKKRLLRKKYKNTFVELLPKNWMDAK